MYTYSHGDNKVGRSLLESAYLGDEECGEVRDEGLDDEDDRDDGKLRELLSCQL